MRKWALTLSVLFFVVYIVSMQIGPKASAQSDRSISIQVNGERLESAEAQIENGRTLVPIRVIAESWGAAVGWNQKLKQVRVQKDGMRIDLFVDQHEANVNGKTVSSDVPPVVKDGRTMLPLRFVGELLGADIAYNSNTREVYVHLAEPADDRGNDPGHGQASPEPTDPGDGKGSEVQLSSLHEVAVQGETITLQTDEAVKPSIFYLTNPERIVIDLPQTQVDLKSSGFTYNPDTYQNILPLNGPLIHAVRVANHNPETSQLRIVIDLKTRGDYDVSVNEDEHTIQLKIKPGTYKLVLDAGHGDHDPGAIGYSKKREKDFNLQLALLLEEMFAEEPRIEASLTRSTDVFLSLQERTDFANQLKADAFISIHANAFRQSTRGTETFYTHEYQKDFAALLQHYLVEATGFPDRKLQRKNFFVTRNTSMPAGLIEVGFLTNPTEEKELFKPEFQERVAKSLVEAVKVHFGL